MTLIVLLDSNCWNFITSEKDFYFCFWHFWYFHLKIQKYKLNSGPRCTALFFCRHSYFWVTFKAVLRGFLFLGSYYINFDAEKGSKKVSLSAILFILFYKCQTVKLSKTEISIYIHWIIQSLRKIREFESSLMVSLLPRKILFKVRK